MQFYTFGAAIPGIVVVVCLVQTMLVELKQSNPLSVIWIFSCLIIIDFS